MILNEKIYLNIRFKSTDPIIDIVIDDQRHILYTLSQNSTIQVYDLGEDGTACKHIIDYTDILRDAQKLLPRVRWDQDVSMIIYNIFMFRIQNWFQYHQLLQQNQKLFI